MSKQQAIEFIKAVNQSQELLDRLKDARDTASLITAGKQHGFTFNADEWAEAIRERHTSTGEVLTDEDLETVAGGTGTPVYGPTGEMQCPGTYEYCPWPADDLPPPVPPP